MKPFPEIDTPLENTGPTSEKPLSFVPVRLSMIPVNSPLPYPIYLRVSEQHVLFRCAGDDLTCARVKSLEEKGVTTVFLTEDSWFNFLEKLMEAPLGGDKDCVDIVHELLINYNESLENEPRFTAKHIGHLRFLADRLAIGIERNPKKAAELLRKHQTTEKYFVTHQVNVSIFSTVIGIKLGLGLRDLRLLTFSALVHNVGNLFIPKHLLHKPAELSAEEWHLVEAHPQKGAALLDAFNAPTEAIVTALQHHERFDGSGYPAKVGGAEIHLFAKICSIADVFAALTSNGPNRTAISADAAVEKMRAMAGKFDPAILSVVPSNDEMAPNGQP